MKKIKYSVEEIVKKSYKTRDTPWANLFWNPFAKYVLWFVSNFTKLTPNALTTISLIIGLCAGVLFLTGNFIFGAILFQISYFFDALDGKLARLLNKSSLLGELYDNITDRAKIIVWSVTILLGTYIHHNQFYFVLLPLIIFSYAYISISMSNLWLFYEKFKIKGGIKTKSEIIHPKNIFLKICEKLKVTPFITDIEYHCFFFTIFPIIIVTKLFNTQQIKFILIAILVMQIATFIVISRYIYLKLRNKR